MTEAWSKCRVLPLIFIVKRENCLHLESKLIRIILNHTWPKHLTIIGGYNDTLCFLSISLRNKSFVKSFSLKLEELSAQDHSVTRPP